jgi:diadenosine tetraphosphate (Ap4A) HIT family hydrolase
MNYEELHEFILHKMRMSHIYQPVMLRTLLENGGECHQSDIAKALTMNDESQIEYYTQITNNMVGKVLRNHGIVVRDKGTKNYCLEGYESLDQEQIDSLIQACSQRLESFLDARGKAIFDHRRKSSGYISGTIRYEVLKRAKFHCELCGVSADEKALEVDHLVPRNHGGSDELSNFQALCYSCNAMKRDRDDTDFRAVRAAYDERDKDCLFCAVDRELIAENELVYAIRDGFPVTPLHSLIIPKRHVASWFDLGQAEVNAITQLLADIKADIEHEDDTVTGFNIGINNGEDAGQTIFHCHVHLIPRRPGDVENPHGGVRHTIPGKGHY